VHKSGQTDISGINKLDPRWFSETIFERYEPEIRNQFDKYKPDVGCCKILLGLCGKTKEEFNDLN
jgi:hypothetical protein